MALSKETKLTKFDINQEYKTISLRLDTVIYDDGKEISRKSHRCAFVPGDIEKVKEYLGVQSSPEIDYLNSIWTQDVIDAYEAYIAQNENNV